MFAELLEKFSAHLGRWIRRRIVWVAAERRFLDVEPFEGEPWLVILGREHYEERRKVYAIRSWRGLRAVLALEIGSDPSVMYSIGPHRSEGREVRFFRLLSSGIKAREDALFLLPESLLLSISVQPDEVLRVYRDDLEYYVAEGCASQMRGGAISNQKLFALSAGIPEGSPVRTLELPDLSTALERALRKVSFGNWWSALVARDRWIRDLPWRRMAVTAAGLIIIYLSFASVYLEIGNAWRERQLSALGTDVDQLLEKQREIDRATAELKGMNQLASERLATHYLWGVLAELWRSGGSLVGVQLEGNQITLRGRASTATAVLSALSKLPQVSSAKFDAPVRAEFGQENFTIVLTLVNPGRS